MVFSSLQDDFFRADIYNKKNDRIRRHFLAIETSDSKIILTRLYRIAGKTAGRLGGAHQYRYGDRSLLFLLKYDRDFPGQPGDSLSVCKAHLHNYGVSCAG